MIARLRGRFAAGWAPQLHRPRALAALLVVVSMLIGATTYTVTKILNETSSTPERVTTVEDALAAIQAERRDRQVERCATDHRIAESIRRQAATLIAAAAAGGTDTSTEGARNYLAATEVDAAAVDCIGLDETGKAIRLPPPGEKVQP